MSADYYLSWTRYYTHNIVELYCLLRQKDRHAHILQLLKTKHRTIIITVYYTFKEDISIF